MRLGIRWTSLLLLQLCLRVLWFIQLLKWFCIFDFVASLLSYYYIYVGNIRNNMSWTRSKFSFQITWWLSEDSSKDTEWRIISSQHGFSSCLINPSYRLTFVRSIFSMILLLLQYINETDFCILNGKLLMNSCLCDSSVGTNVGDIGLWEVLSGEIIIQKF